MSLLPAGDCNLQFEMDKLARLILSTGNIQWEGTGAMVNVYYVSCNQMLQLSHSETLS